MNVPVIDHLWHPSGRVYAVRDGDAIITATTDDATAIRRAVTYQQKEN